MYFSNFYPQISIGTSSDTEFTLNTSLMPANSGTVFVQYYNRDFVSIPKLLAENAVKRYLNWYYTTQEKGKWKKCSRCGEIKLAHNLYFSKNKTSKDGFYSICKDCRNKKTDKEEEK